MADIQHDDIVKYRQMQKKFRHACRQVVLLNNKISDVQLRYDRAVKENKRSWRYVARLNLASIEGVRNMFYEYACRRADELDQMQDRLINAGINLGDWSMEGDSEEDAPAVVASVELSPGDEADEEEDAGESEQGNEEESTFMEVDSEMSEITDIERSENSENSDEDDLCDESGGEGQSSDTQDEDTESMQRLEDVIETLKEGQQ